MPLNDADLQAIGRTVAAAVASAVSPPKPWWRRVDGIGSVLATCAAIASVATVILTANGIGDRISEANDSIKRLDDRLTPAPHERLPRAPNEHDAFYMRFSFGPA